MSSRSRWSSPEISMSNLSSAAYATDNTCFSMIYGHRTPPLHQREQVEGEEAAGWVHGQEAGMDGGHAAWQRDD
jgi:hypothetical protein